MDSKLLKAQHIILISLGLALVFNFLFFHKLLGVSFPIFTVILLGTVFLFGQYQKVSMKRTSWLMLLIIFFALMTGIHDNEFLTFLNVVATFGLLMLLAHGLVGTPAILMRIRDYFILAILVPLRMLGRALSTLSSIGQIHSSVGNRDVWLRVFKGAVMAVPILIIFGALFSQADLAFSQFLKGFINIHLEESAIEFTALLVLSFVAGLCYLSYIFFPKQTQPALLHDQVDKEVQPGKGIEVLVFLGLISALFLVFIGFQVTYLFGGETNIVNTGFTYAEYARRGFWELLWVAVMSLVVLLASEKYAGVQSKKDKRFMIPALLLIVEVIVVITSAFKRLSLYIDTYGMTELRFYVAGFIILLLVLFILLAVKFIKSKREEFFTFATLLSVVTFLIVINIINPHAFIIRANIEQFNQTGKLDADYVGRLSADAVSGKVELYKKLEGNDKEILRGLLQKQKERLQESSSDWRSSNYSRNQALKLLQEIQ
jgi:hypothetical protein